MHRSRDSLIWGAVLVIIGIGFLLWNLNVFENLAGTAELVVAGFFALVGLGFLVSFLMARDDWWKVIPGFALLAVGAIVFLGTRDVPSEWIGGMLFLGLALAFAVIYAGDRQERWWALIPFGAMIIMVGIVLLSSLDVPEELLGAALFGGMGLVFLLVYVLAQDRPQFSWTLIPATVLFIMSLMALAAFAVESSPNLEELIRWWPALLVIIGVIFLLLSLRRPAATSRGADVLPTEPSPREMPAAPGTSAVEIDEDYVPPAYVPIEPAPIKLPEEGSQQSPPTPEGQLSGTPENVGEVPEFQETAPASDTPQDPKGESV